jgi:hypothetical protein
MPALPPVHHGRACAEPKAVLHGKAARGHRELLIQWKGLQATNATWRDLAEFRSMYPRFQLDDELLVEEGRDVMIGIRYQRCKHSAAVDQGSAPA